MMSLAKTEEIVPQTDHSQVRLLRFFVRFLRCVPSATHTLAQLLCNNSPWQYEMDNELVSTRMHYEGHGRNLCLSPTFARRKYKWREECKL